MDTSAEQPVRLPLVISTPLPGTLHVRATAPDPSVPLSGRLLAVIEPRRATFRDAAARAAVVALLVGA